MNKLAGTGRMGLELRKMLETYGTKAFLLSFLLLSSGMNNMGLMGIRSISANWTERSHIW
jgi:hypothetical protein